MKAKSFCEIVSTCVYDDLGDLDCTGGDSSGSIDSGTWNDEWESAAEWKECLVNAG